MSKSTLYKRMYLQLAYDVSYAVSLLDAARFEVKDVTGAQKEQALEEQIEDIIISLRKAQQKTEQIYIDG